MSSSNIRSPKKQLRFSLGSSYSPLKLTGRPRFSDKPDSLSSSRPITVGASDKSLRAIQEKSHEKQSRFKTISAVINETDRLDPNVLKSVSGKISVICKEVPVESL